MTSRPTIGTAPIRFGGGDFNLYGYVFTDPINNADLAGLQSQSLCSFYANYQYVKCQNVCRQARRVCEWSPVPVGFPPQPCNDFCFQQAQGWELRCRAVIEHLKDALSDLKERFQRQGHPF